MVGGYWVALGAPLAGKVVGIDPGHNGGNGAAPAVIDSTGVQRHRLRAVRHGRDRSSRRLHRVRIQLRGGFATCSAELMAEGASVVMTRPDDQGVGPCVTTRAAILDDAHVDVAVDIHVDGGPPDGRGFTVLTPVPVGPNDGVVASSASLAVLVRDALVAGTPMPVSDYGGVDGIEPRDDLAGLNLTTVPKVLLESGNLQNPSDTALLEAPSFQQAAADALASADHPVPGGRPLTSARSGRRRCRAGAPAPRSCRRGLRGKAPMPPGRRPRPRSRPRAGCWPSRPGPPRPGAAPWSGPA